MYRHNGQILPLVLFSLVIACTLLIVMFNTTQKITDKTIASNAADAAAYSAGVWTARNLNYMAYTNRAMVANHVAVGHLIAHTSWLRYVATSSKHLAKASALIPYVNEATAAISSVVDAITVTTEAATPILIASIDTINQSYALSQKLAFSDIAFTKIDNLMKANVKLYDSSFLVNDISSIPNSVIKAKIVADIIKQKSDLLSYVKFKKSINDNGKLSDMLKMSLSGSEQWLNNRKWNKSLLVVKINKEATSKMTLNNWDESDKLRFGSLSAKGWKWTTLGSGNANVKSVYSPYVGLSDYVSWQQDKNENGIELVSLITKSDKNSNAKDLYTIKNLGSTIAAISKSKVYFEKPQSDFNGHSSEFANLFNPFWRVKLIDASQLN